MLQHLFYFILYVPKYHIDFAMLLLQILQGFGILYFFFNYFLLLTGRRKPIDILV